MVGRRLLAVQPALVASQHPAVLLLGGPSTEKVNLYLPKLPDGTVIWTSPTGHTYTTKPGSAVLFPTLCLPTGTLRLPRNDTAVVVGDRGGDDAQTPPEPKTSPVA